MAKRDITKAAEAAEKLLKRPEITPHQRRILENYRRHVLLEVAGRWEEIFVPEMTVESPLYVVNRTHQRTVLDGRGPVREFYADQAKDGGHVTVIEDENLAVADWGIATEVTLNKYVPGWVVRRKGFEEVDGQPVEDSAPYCITSRTAMIWPYNERAQLVGEHLYEDATTLKIERMDSHENDITGEEAAKLLEPYIEPLGTHADWSELLGAAN